VVQQIITNAADAEIFGIEIDGFFPITEKLFLSGSLGLIDGEFTDVTLNLNTPDAAGLALPAGADDLELDIPRLSPVTASFGITYLHDVNYGRYSFNFNYSNRDETPFTDNNSTWR